MNLAEMTNLGLPIPQGFTVTTEACTDYYNSGRQITDEIKFVVLHKIYGKKFSKMKTSNFPSIFFSSASLPV